MAAAGRTCQHCEAEDSGSADTEACNAGGVERHLAMEESGLLGPGANWLAGQMGRPELHQAVTQCRQRDPLHHH